MVGNGHKIEGAPIAVDLWSLQHCIGAKLFFLTHLHSDHIQGLGASWPHLLYTSPLNARLLPLFCKVNPRLIRPLEVGEKHLLYLNEKESDTVTVTVYDANHCPGAVMFLFELSASNVLYTGDFRYCRKMAANMELPSIDLLYLDNTYCFPQSECLSQEVATEKILMQIHECLHQSKRVVLGLDRLGKETLMVHIAEETCSKIHVSKERLEILRALGLESIATTDDREAKVTVVATREVHCVALDRWNQEKKTCAVLPTARFSCIGNNLYQHKKIHIIPYSLHSHFQELREFVEFVKPRRILPVVRKDVRGVFGTDLSDRARMSVFDDLLDVTPMLDFGVTPASLWDNAFIPSPKVPKAVLHQSSLTSEVVHCRKRPHMLNLSCSDSKMEDVCSSELLNLRHIAANNSVVLAQNCNVKTINSPQKACSLRRMSTGSGDEVVNKSKSVMQNVVGSKALAEPRQESHRAGATQKWIQNSFEPSPIRGHTATSTTSVGYHCHTNTVSKFGITVESKCTNQPEVQRSGSSLKKQNKNNFEISPSRMHTANSASDTYHSNNACTLGNEYPNQPGVQRSELSMKKQNKNQPSKKQKQFTMCKLVHITEDQTVIKYVKIFRKKL